MLGEIEKVSTHRQRLGIDLGSRTYSKDFKRLAAPDRLVLATVIPFLED